MTRAEERIIQRVNSEIGSDITKLHRSRNLAAHYHQELEKVQAKLSLNNTRITSPLKTVLNLSDATSSKIDLEIDTINEYNDKITEKLDRYQTTLDGVADKLAKIKNLNNLVGYFKIFKDIQEINAELALCINGKDEQRVINLYLALCGDMNSNPNTLLGRLYNVNAAHLFNYALEVSKYWHEILKEKFTKDFESVLKSMKWPHLGQTLELFNPSKEQLSKLSNVAEYLFLIKPPGDDLMNSTQLTDSIIMPPISLTIQLLVKPFRQRFMYHFAEQRQTNRLDKPEWYLTQILSWIRDNHLLVSQNLQQAARRAMISEINVRVEFVRGLVQLPIEKLCNDIEEIAEDEGLFAHLLDEVLAFEQELKELVKINYLSNFPSVLSVLTQPDYLMKWLRIEEKLSTNRMDAMLKYGQPFEVIDPGSDEDLRIPKCADQFIRLLDAIKERYCCLPETKDQFQFLYLQLELIENFRTRLVQLHNSTVDDVSTTDILNTINYVNSVLREWGENIHYLYLRASGVDNNDDEIDSVFDESIEKFENWQRKLITQLSYKIVDDIKAKSMAYRHDNWVSMHEQNSKEPFILSTTAGEMFQIMVTNLHNLESELSSNLFSIALRLIAEKLDQFFIDSMIMNSKFTMGGAAQFNFDMTRNLFPLFGQYSRKPELLFKKIHNACILLTLTQGVAMLLYQTIKHEPNLEMTQSALKELHVVNLSTRTAVEILERRTDICL